MRDEDLPESGNIEDRRGESGPMGGGFGGGGFGGGFGFPGGGGGMSIGGILILGLIGYALGIDPRLLIGGAEIIGGGGGSQTRMETPTTQRKTSTPTDESGRFVSRILGSTEARWKEIFAKDGATYHPPILVLYKARTDARCGSQAQSAMGPFYCPVDKKVYLDTSFFSEIETRFRGCEGRSCRFSQAYVIAHEIGHHVQNELGVLPRAQRSQQAAGDRAAANHIQVQVELQADCLAGVWAKAENDNEAKQGKPAFVEQGDVDAALRTAAAIGDDTLQRRAGREVVPDSFTHGTSEQRQRWFSNGFKAGTVASCNTFSARQL